MMNWFRGNKDKGAAASNEATSPQSGPPTSPQNEEERVPSPIHGDRKDVEPPVDNGQEPQDIPADEADEVLSGENSSLILQLVRSGQLVVGLDLTKVVLPTFILEPRSLLEKLSDFYMHSNLFYELNSKELIPGYNADVSRMLRVVRWYMSGFHIRPKGVKKPYNPILGEQYECEISVPGVEGEKVWFVAEQVSHHPPITAYYVQSGGVQLHGTYYPRSKFLGNSAACIGEGCSTLVFDDGQVYQCTWPTAYVRGILFGKLLMEAGGKIEIKCVSSGMQADIDFKVKGYFSGSYNAVVGGIFYTSKGYKNPEVILGGNWTQAVTFHPAKDKKNVQALLDVKGLPYGVRSVSTKAGIPPTCASRNVWAKVTEALAANDVEGATREKNVVENAQRERRKEMAAKNEEHPAHLFKDVCPTKNHGTRTYGMNVNFVYVGPGVQSHPFTTELVEKS
eukprot:PhF_6_TR42733/c1_g2_i1/m.64579